MRAPAAARAVRRATKSEWPVSSRKMPRRSNPNTSTWCKAQGASRRLWQGMAVVALPHLRLSPQCGARDAGLSLIRRWQTWQRPQDIHSGLGSRLAHYRHFCNFRLRLRKDGEIHRHCSGLAETGVDHLQQSCDGNEIHLQSALQVVVGVNIEG